MKKLNVVLVILLVLLIGVLFYADRAQLMSTYDAAYWKDRFEHSQWQLPLSNRTLGDNGLYAYIGYQLVHGADPTKYNAEMPPLGKYAIGAAIQFFGNGSWYGVISSILVCILFYILAKRVLKNTFFALAATVWLACDPLLVSQWPATMLDTLHLAALLLFFVLLGSSADHPYTVLRVAAVGCALGIFSAIKYPIVSVILLTAGQYYIWKKTHSKLNAVIFFVSAAGIYLLSYTRYFLLGHTLVDWLRVQKWMFTFYADSRLQSNIGSVWTTLFINRYQNLFTRLWQSVPEWSAAWPVIAILNGYMAWLFLKQKPRRVNLWLTTVWISIILIMVFYTFITFWARYLLLVIPFLYIGAAAAIRTFKYKWMIVACVFVLLVFNAYTSWQSIFPTPEADIQQFVYDWKNGFFQDMYERFTVGAKGGNKYIFHRNMQQIVRNGEIEAVNITIYPIAWKQFTNPQYVSLEVTYSTRYLGEFSQTIHLPVVNENGRWRIPWQPQLFISGLTEDDTLKTTVIPATRGAIKDHSGKILAEDIPGSVIWITPKLVDTTKETAMLTYLQTIFGGLPRFSAIGFYHRYSVNSQPDLPVPIGVLSLNEQTQSALLSYPGISLTPAVGRLETPESGLVGNTHYTECCSSLYTTTAYDGISGLEKTYNTKLKGQNGGTLVIVDKTGNTIHTLINKEKKDGEDISL